MADYFHVLSKTLLPCTCLCISMLASGVSHATTAASTTAAKPVAASAKPISASLPRQDFTVEIRQVDEGSRGGKTYGTQLPRDLMETQQIHARNGEKASLRISLATPVQWVPSAQAPSSSTGGSVKQALIWLESGQTIALTPTWRGGNQPVVVDVDVQTASVQANPGGALPQQARSQVATTVSAPLGEWVTLAVSGNRPQRTTYSSEAASETRLVLEIRVVVR